MSDSPKPSCCGGAAACAAAPFPWLEMLTSLRAIILSGVTVLLSLTGHLIGQPVMELACALLAVLISGTPIVYAAMQALFIKRRIKASLLITLGMGAALAIGEYFAAAEVAFIMALGEYLEDRALARSKSEIRALLQLVPRRARLLDEKTGQERDVEANLVQVGQLVRILPGESIPVDGIIEHGESSVDQSILTGESLPIDKQRGDELLCGTTNLHGVIELRCTRRSTDSSLNKMVRLVDEAEKSKSPIQRQADKWASFLVPVALLIAILTYLFTAEVINAVTVLVVFCPCALVLATPVSIMAAIGQASKNGVLIKNGAALEALGSLNAIAFDKTGTLTQGKLKVSDCLYVDEENKVTVDNWIARAEKRSEHPLAKAIVAQFRQQYGEEAFAQLDSRDDVFHMLPGQGVSLLSMGQKLLCGNKKLMEEEGIALEESLVLAAQQFQEQGKALVFAALDGQIIALLALSDELRPSAAQTIADLEQLGMTVSMLTGDHAVSAQHFAKKVGIADVHSELLPEDKLAHIQSKQQSGEKIAMLGDGVNDAAALKLANVGIAMGKAGSDVAIDSADIALFGEDLGKLRYLRRLSKATLGSIRFNITLSLVLNIAALSLAVTGLIGPVVGALLHNVGSVLVVMNAMRLFRKKID